VLPTPNPGPGPRRIREGDWLQGVSCVSAAACTAVGYLEGSQGPDRSIIESWNGTTWTAVPHPTVATADNTLAGVSCATSSKCTAVGSARFHRSTPVDTLIESWNGTAWSLVPSPNAAGAAINRLAGVSCPGTAMCVAVGSFQSTSTSPGRTLVESWDGSAWAISPSPNPGGSSISSGLRSVSCPATAACEAAGSFSNSQPDVARTLIEQGAAPASS
jgi:hypothetical protein